MKKKIGEFLFWCILALSIGAMFSAGEKAVDAIWPDEPTVINHVIEQQN